MIRLKQAVIDTVWLVLAAFALILCMEREAGYGVD
jgi:hypothetical protein